MVTDIRKKGILLLASFLLLLAAGVYMAYAWYTKMTGVNDMVFDAARWEYSANYAVDSFSLGVYTSPVTGEDFTAVVNGKAAPGTCGYAPIRISAASSDTAVEYVLKVDKSTMSTEFQERIFFYQDSDNDGVPDKAAGDDLGSTEREGNVIEGTVAPGTETTVYVYWKWAYDLAEAKELGGVSAITTASDDEEFDAFDTKVGKNPDRYEGDMQAQILITGTQLEPPESTGQWNQMN